MPSGGATPPGGVSPPHKATILLAPPIHSIREMDREYAAGDGLSKSSIDILTILLGEPLEGGGLVPINTVKWKNLVDMLEGLGFRHAGRDVFMNDKNRRLHLHALHYDDYRMNYQLLGILFKQLAYYDFTPEVLKGMLISKRLGGEINMQVPPCKSAAVSLYIPKTKVLQK